MNCTLFILTIIVTVYCIPRQVEHRDGNCLLRYFKETHLKTFQCRSEVKSIAPYRNSLNIANLRLLSRVSLHRIPSCTDWTFSKNTIWSFVQYFNTFIAYLSLHDLCNIKENYIYIYCIQQILFYTRPSYVILYIFNCGNFFLTSLKNYHDNASMHTK